MKNVRTYFFMICLVVFITSCKNHVFDNKPIVFDYYKSYPEIVIKLSDVAEVTYIPMRKGEQESILPGDSMWGDLYVDETVGKIYFLQMQKIYVYDLQGNPIQILNKIGRGPDEYLSMTRFWVEKDNNEVYCYSIMGKSFTIYDTLFNYKRRISLPTPAMQDIVRTNADTLLIYNHVAEFDTESRFPNYFPFFFTMSSSTTKAIKTINYHIERPVRNIADGPEFLLYPSIIRGLNGLFMTNKCCDTVLWMNTKTMEVTPRFIDITNYHTPECMTIPSFETEKYLFFDTHFAPKLSPKIIKKYYLYDKTSKKIFQIKARAYEALENQLGLLNNECALTSTISTQNPNYAATFIQPLFLLENRDNLPPELHPMVDTLNENDNPVLMLIKLKE